jgi:release factor glutamine methyltransferase
VITTSTTGEKWTVLGIINWGTEYFASKGIESARLNIELLLSHLLSCSRIQLYTNFDRPLTPADLAALKKLVQRRIAHEPLQYILGATSFLGYELRVDTRALIPRPETELLIEEIVHDASQHPRRSYLDIGTGSGNIPIAIAKRVPDALVDSVDISADALALAAINVRAHRLEERCALVQGDVMSARWAPPRANYDVIVSNPPYISQYEFAELAPEIRHFEPAIATTDNADGLSFYNRIADVGTRFLAEGGKIIVEIAYNQLNDVTAIFSGRGFGRIDVRRDYAAIPRCLMISRK